eukprot:2889420-Rhodomonas_salina.1
MPCGGGGFAGGGPGCRMRGKGNGVRQGFSGGVPGRKRSRIFWRGARAQEALGKWSEARRGRRARGCWGLFWGLRGLGSRSWSRSRSSKLSPTNPSTLLL